MPEPVQSYCRTTVASNILDWRAAAGFTPTIAEFAALDMPCTLVRGEHANPALAEVTDREVGKEELQKAVEELDDA